MKTSIEFTRQASLVMVGQKFLEMGLWSAIEKYVMVKQKVRYYTPHQKMLDAFITMLAGGRGIVEVNTCIRPDRVVQLAFGRTGCAEQSTISEMFNACTAETVQQMRQALKVIIQQHSQCYQHDYRHRWQVLDIDMTGLPCGPQCVGATKGYFAHQPQRRGRQLGRVLATLYDEIIAERLYEGKYQLDKNFKELILTAEEVLDLAENKPKRTILRVDGGAGDEANINWALRRGYHLLTKVKNWQRAYKLAKSVRRWYADSKVSDREIGWVEQPTVYTAPTRQLAIRHPKKKKDGSLDWHYHVLVFTLTDAMLWELAKFPKVKRLSSRQVMFAALYAYDLRDGGLETQNRGDKQGLGLAHRNKRSFAAQEMLVLLAQLAHNFVIWSRNQLAKVAPHFRKFGIQRIVRDLFQIDGQAIISATGHIQRVTLNPKHPYADAFQRAFGDDL